MSTPARLCGLAALALSASAAAAADGEQAVFRDLDRNQDGLISLAEAQRQPFVVENFGQLDVNANGYLSRAEFREATTDGALTPGRDTRGEEESSRSDVQPPRPSTSLER